MKVLFIGNSYTFGNNMPDIFVNICKSTNTPIECNAITRSGAALDGFSNPLTNSGKKVLAELEKKYDYVFIQEQSNRGVVNKNKFFDSVSKLTKSIKEYNSIPILYETWAKLDGHSDLIKYHLTTTEMFIKLIENFNEASNLFDIKLSEVGKVFYYIYQNKIDLKVYGDDLSHPSKLGSFIIALVHYYTITNRVDEVTYCDEFSIEMLDKIKEIIKKAV